jgi:hypothetical protein
VQFVVVPYVISAFLEPLDDEGKKKQKCMWSTIILVASCVSPLSFAKCTSIFEALMFWQCF